MSPESKTTAAPDALLSTAETTYESIARAFPVSSSSDEFYFFPQVVTDPIDWSCWDDFSPKAIQAIASELHQAELVIAHLTNEPLGEADLIDAELLIRVFRTLREQLCDIRAHESQPTLHLTLLVAGLSDALSSGEARAWSERVDGVPEFLERAKRCLFRVPTLFRDLGLEMVSDLRDWCRGLDTLGYDVSLLESALQSFGSFLEHVQVSAGYLMPGEAFERILVHHLDCGQSLEWLERTLQRELAAMEQVLSEETARLGLNVHWTKAKDLVPFVDAGPTGLLGLYHSELSSMEEHCRQFGLIPASLPDDAELKIAEVPRSLAAIRASDAYSARPGHPCRGGTFYVMEDKEQTHRPGRSLEYRMTASHEVWPGHHLLDLCRWSLMRRIRRPVESPLLYEGWACVSEEILARTGYFVDPWDRFLLAKRRAERAARGLIDWGLQSGVMSLDEGVAALVRVGYPRRLAQRIVPKYLLRPGYQVCYTHGLLQALGLLDRLGPSGLLSFSKTILDQGQIGFQRLGPLMASGLET